LQGPAENSTKPVDPGRTPKKSTVQIPQNQNSSSTSPARGPDSSPESSTYGMPIQGFNVIRLYFFVIDGKKKNLEH
jgi:hypothetical protein